MRTIVLACLLLVPAGFTCAESRLGFIGAGWRTATHVVVVSEGDVIDGDVTVVESWRGDLEEGAHLHLPWLARFADRETRRVDEWLPPYEEKEARYLSCDRMLVLLDRVEEQPAGITAWKPAGSPTLSSAWISGGTVYAFISGFDGASMGLRDYRTEPVMKKMLADFRGWYILEEQARADAVEAVQRARQAECAEKVEVLRDAARSRWSEARDLVLHELTDTGDTGVDMLTAIYEDTDLSEQARKDAVSAIARTGGSRAGPVLLDILRRERETSQAIAYSAAQALLGLRYRPAMDDVAAFVGTQPENVSIRRPFKRARCELAGEPDPFRGQSPVPLSEEERFLAGYSNQAPGHLIPPAGPPAPVTGAAMKSIEAVIMPLLEAALEDSPEAREKAVAELIALRVLVSEELSKIARAPEASGRTDALAVMGEIGIVDSRLWGADDEFGWERPEWNEDWHDAVYRARLRYLNWREVAVVEPEITTSLDGYPALQQAMEDLQSPKDEVRRAGKIILLHWYNLVCSNLYRSLPRYGATEATPAHATAVFLLGEYRAWAEQRLFSNIDMRDPNGTCDGYPRSLVVNTSESDYPCFVALLKLGGRVDEQKCLNLIAWEGSLVTRERVARYFAAAGGRWKYRGRINDLLFELDLLRSVEPIVMAPD